ncbi:MAG: NgoFVII family restriction endonuclease [Planctomycetes bacterium]|nr:NgoFVII family restriction endonuclease [Planctomycetota bacterium]
MQKGWWGEGWHFRASRPSRRRRENMARREAEIDNQTALQLKKRLAQDFRDQLTVGIPTNDDEASLRRLAVQIKNKKVVVKLFLRHPLHAKLYLLFRPDPVNPTVSFLGSSNLTMAGLSHRGELNVDVLDHDACDKLARWFEDRWNDRWCIDISDELVQIIDESWAGPPARPPYHIYIKIAYHLSQEARAGLTEFQIPADFRNRLFESQKAAVKIAAHHLNKRGGVLIGDVVGLGKTLMASALARVFEDDFGLETLIICPKNLIPMWEDHRDQYRLRGPVLSMSRVMNALPDLRRYRLVILDESHNLRNREGKRYRAIQEYIRANDSKVVLLSATPYNKTYLDLANQLRIFIEKHDDLGIRPECLIREKGELEFGRLQVAPRSIAAFEKSGYADDWRELMRLYLVRRTRSFIQDNYAIVDCTSCEQLIQAIDRKCPRCGKARPKNGRRYLIFEDGSRSYFPTRAPKTVKFKINNAGASDQYARLYADDVVAIINHLNLPRYGLANYVTPSFRSPPTPTETDVLRDLSRAGNRLRGFCRTGLFKRLESSGQAFLQSIERHILRNYVYLHAIDKGEPISIGTQDAELLDPRFSDEDDPGFFDGNDDNVAEGGTDNTGPAPLRTEAEFKERAAKVYDEYAGPMKTRFKWLRPALFVDQLARDLRADIQDLVRVLRIAGEWDAARDAKLNALENLLAKKHSDEKVLVFTQFADTVRYLETQLKARGLNKIAGVTGNSDDPRAIAWQFSPVSNQKRDRISTDQELRVVVATDVLSEGQNLQDAAIVVNYDLPWAIIRLIQRAGRVDRIGQKAENILCYSFLPAEGVDRIIRLRARVRQRLRENAEVVGADEKFFEDQPAPDVIRDLFTEKAGILDDDVDSEVDLASYAFQIWQNAIKQDPNLEKLIPGLPNVVYATRSHPPTPDKPAGVLVYLRSADANDALAWIDKNGRSVTESQFAILKAAECLPETPALPRQENHHALVEKALQQIFTEEKQVGGLLGRPSGARFRTYERLKRYADQVKGTLFESAELLKAIDDIYRYPLRQTAVDSLNRQLKGGAPDDLVAQSVIDLRREGRLCLVEEEQESQEPRVICSMGLAES